MKKAMVLAITMASLSALSANEAAADLSTEAKQELTTLGSIATGAVAAGPVGAVAGLLVSIWLVDEVGKAGELEQTLTALEARNHALSGAQQQVADLEQQLASARQDQSRLAKSMLASLELEMMFKTGEATLNKDGQTRLKTLARYLKRNPELIVRVHGFADPRGTAADNLNLSKARAAAVADSLVASGVPADRLQVNGYGERQSVAASHDIDAMAMERKVVIELARPRGVAVNAPR